MNIFGKDLDHILRTKILNLIGPILKCTLNDIFGYH